MFRTSLLLAALCVTASAQFDSLQTTDDGSVLLFQSAWRLANTPDVTRSRIFRHDASGFVQLSPPSTTETLSLPFSVSPFLSGDGKVFGYGLFPGCSGTGCASVKPTLVLNGATAPANLPPSFNLAISRNGRYLVSGTTVADLSTGATQTISTGLIPGGRYGVSNAGGVLVLVIHSAFIVSSTDLTLSTKPGVVIVHAPVVLNAVVSATENRVVYEIWGDTSATRDQLWSYDVASGQSTKLDDIPLGTPLGISQFQPAISNDGSRLLYQRPRSAGGFEVVLVDFKSGATSNIATTTIAQVLPSSSNFVISGDGKSAWVHRIDGKLVSIALDSMQATEVPGRHAWMAQQEGGPVPGSYHHLFGGGFALDDTSGPVAEVTVDLEGAPFPIVGGKTRELDIQIPWVSPQPGQYPLTLHSSSSPFVSVLPLDLETFAPTFERSGMPMDPQRSIIVAHQDFHGVVTRADPAIPGEVVHAYMTGLGGTQPTPLTGSPPTGLAVASIQPVCSIALPFKNPEPAPVTFAGLAPGLVGMYQVDILIPQDVSLGDQFSFGDQSLICFVEAFGFGISGDFGNLPVGKAQ